MSSKQENRFSSTEQCYKNIDEVVNESILHLYDSIRNFIFQKNGEECLVHITPKWISDGGISPEFSYTKNEYEKLRRKCQIPLARKAIYYHDLCGIVTAIQDRLEAVKMFMLKLNKIVPYEAKYEEKDYTSAMRTYGERETEAHMLLNSIFVAYASVFDLLSKIAVEQFEYHKYDFIKYNKMSSSNTIFNKNLKNIDSSLKQDIMIFSEPSIVRRILTFRNEFVHNGPWDYRCSVYYTAIDGVPADVLIYSPDMDENGNFIASGSRNKFYSQANRINVQLPNLINDATVLLKNTIEQITTLYEKGILPSR